MRTLFLLALTVLTACSGSNSSATTNTTPQENSSSGGTNNNNTSTRPPRPSGGGGEGMTIEGQLGYLSREQLTRVLDPATSALQRCYTDRLADSPYLGGRVEFKVRIGADGTVLWAHQQRTTLGDRTTENCMIQRLMALRFDAPRGGETETTVPLELDGGDDMRPATEWTADRVRSVIDQHRANLQRCRQGATGAFDVTVYAAPRGGSVATASVSVPSHDAATAADCIHREVASWRLPDPGSWYARASFRVE